MRALVALVALTLAMLAVAASTLRGMSFRRRSTPGQAGAARETPEWSVGRSSTPPPGPSFIRHPRHETSTRWQSSEESPQPSGFLSSSPRQRNIDAFDEWVSRRVMCYNKDESCGVVLHSVNDRKYVPRLRTDKEPLTNMAGLATVRRTLDDAFFTGVRSRTDTNVRRPRSDNIALPRRLDEDVMSQLKWRAFFSRDDNQNMPARVSYNVAGRVTPDGRSLVTPETSEDDTETASLSSRSRVWLFPSDLSAVFSTDETSPVLHARQEGQKQTSPLFKLNLPLSDNKPWWKNNDFSENRSWMEFNDTRQPPDGATQLTQPSLKSLNHMEAARSTTENHPREGKSTFDSNASMVDVSCARTNKGVCSTAVSTLPRPRITVRPERSIDRRFVIPPPPRRHTYGVLPASGISNVVKDMSRRVSSPCSDSGYGRTIPDSVFSVKDLRVSDDSENYVNIPTSSQTRKEDVHDWTLKHPANQGAIGCYPAAGSKKKTRMYNHSSARTSIASTTKSARNVLRSLVSKASARVPHSRRHVSPDSGESIRGDSLLIEDKDAGPVTRGVLAVPSRKSASRWRRALDVLTRLPSRRAAACVPPMRGRCHSGGTLPVSDSSEEQSASTSPTMTRSAVLATATRTRAKALLDRARRSSARQAHRLASHVLSDSENDAPVRHRQRPRRSARPRTSLNTLLSRLGLRRAVSSDSLYSDEEPSPPGALERARIVLTRLFLTQEGKRGRLKSGSGDYSDGVTRARGWLDAPLRVYMEQARRMLGSSSSQKEKGRYAQSDDFVPLDDSDEASEESREETPANKVEQRRRRRRSSSTSSEDGPVLRRRHPTDRRETQARPRPRSSFYVKGSDIVSTERVAWCHSAEGDVCDSSVTLQPRASFPDSVSHSSSPSPTLLYGVARPDEADLDLLTGSDDWDLEQNSKLNEPLLVPMKTFAKSPVASSSRARNDWAYLETRPSIRSTYGSDAEHGTNTFDYSSSEE